MTYLPGAVLFGRNIHSIHRLYLITKPHAVSWRYRNTMLTVYSYDFDFRKKVIKKLHIEYRVMSTLCETYSAHANTAIASIYDCRRGCSYVHVLVVCNPSTPTGRSFVSAFDGHKSIVRGVWFPQTITVASRGPVELVADLCKSEDVYSMHVMWLIRSG